MLTSIKFKNYIKYDEKTDLYSHEYELTDDELGVHLVSGEVTVASAVTFAGATIKFYEERNLNVPSNLARAFICYNNKSSCSLEDIIFWNLKYNPKYLPYHEEVQKYLVVI